LGARTALGSASDRLPFERITAGSPSIIPQIKY